VETFTCPQCGGKTDYDPGGVGQEMRKEHGPDGQAVWSVYCRVRCAHCGHEALVLRDRKPLP
jgi:DNA-directed RNA polymerase subunit RPC12/RpoP